VQVTNKIRIEADFRKALRALACEGFAIRECGLIMDSRGLGFENQGISTQNLHKH
jgi:hypothetical protein